MFLIALSARNPQWGFYFDTIEHILNTGVYYTACAINTMLSIYYIGDDCSGVIGEDGAMEHIKHQDAEWLGDKQSEWEQAWLNQYEMAKAMTIYGLLISLIAIVVVSKIDLTFLVIAI